MANNKTGSNSFLSLLTFAALFCIAFIPLMIWEFLGIFSFLFTGLFDYIEKSLPKGMMDPVMATIIGLSVATILFPQQSIWLLIFRLIDTLF